MKILVLCAGLLLGGGAGYLIANRDEPRDGVSVSPPRSDSASLGGSDGGTSPPAILPVQSSLEPQLVAARTRIADLEKALAKANEESADLRRRVAAQPPAVDPAQVAGKIETLRGNGFRAFLAPGATSDIVSDLKALGPVGLDLLRGLLASEDAADRFLAAKLLEDLGDPASIGDLMKAAGDSDEQVANMASHALALMGGPDSVNALRKILEGQPGDGVRVNSLFGLARSGDAAGIQQSLAYLQDTNHAESMRRALAGGFLVLDDPRVMPVIDHISTTLRSSEGAMQAVIAYYGRVNDTTARNRLQDLANDTSLPAAIRAAATAALAN